MKSPFKLLPDKIKPPVDFADVENEWSHHPERAREDVKNYLKDEVFTLNYYRIHMLYFIVTIAIASVIVYGEGLANDSSEINGTRLRYVDALFLSASAMTTTGLNTVNLGSITAFQQAVLAILLILGNVTFVSIGVVYIRRYFFRRKLADIVKSSQIARKVISDIEQAKAQKKARKSSNASEGARLRKKRLQESPTQRTLHYKTGHGSWPAPWETRIFQRLFRYPFQRLKIDWETKEHSYVSFDPDMDDKGRFRALSEDERCELGGVEYRALGVLLSVLIAYQIAWLALGTVLLVPYSYRRAVVEILRNSQEGNLDPGWWAFFTVITGYCNGGLNLLNANFIPLRGFYFILIVEGALTIAGNTQFPIFLRLIIWTLSKIVPKQSRIRQTLQFLLDHPRRCFIYLFPSKETWYLLAIQITIDFSMWILFIVLNIGMPAVEQIPWATRVFDGLFQATGLRTSGAYIISMSSLAPALLIAYLITMYVSSFPIVMALRQTNTYEERSIGLDKGDAGGGWGQHLRRQLAYDIWFQLLAWFLICIIERGKIVSGQDGFNSFAILFEVTSAYGTVGLSTGVSYDNYSLSGAFQSLSKVVLLFVMVRGRHRGLPLAIDRSILLPGEDLMKKMDKDYNERGIEALERDREKPDHKGEVEVDAGSEQTR